MAEVYLSITIDTECDKGPGWQVQHPLTFRSVVHAVPQRLEPVFQSLGMPATYLLSPEVMYDDASVEILKMAERAGAEMGTHLHGEFIEPQPKLDAERTITMQNTYSREIEKAKLTHLTNLFEEKFGRRPTSFRAGRFGIGPDSLSILSDLGYRVDSSVAPFSYFNDKGGAVTFMGALQQPYYPHRKDFLRHGDLPILEVPVTIGDTLWSRVPRRVQRTVPRFPRAWGPLQKVLKRQLKPRWLRPTWSNLEQMKTLIDNQIVSAGNKPLFLVMMFHNVELEPGCSPYNKTEQDVDAFLQRLSGTLEYAASLGVRCIGLSEVRDVYESMGGLVNAV